jgi:hypothetical protein
MSNVIHVEFGKNTVTENIQFNEDSSLFEYLDSLREQGIDEDDVLDVADAINSYEVYLEADEVVQQLADEWLQNIV